jgi:hypothetical protein
VRAAEQFAYRLMTGVTIPAVAARHMVRREDSVTDAEISDTVADLDDLSGNLVAQDQGRFLDPIPFHQVTAADPARPNTHQQLTDANFWDEHLFKPHVLIIVVHGHPHAAAERFRRQIPM